MTLVVIVLIAKKCRIAQSKRFVWAPFAVFALAITYSVLYILQGGSVYGVGMIDVTIAFCAFTAGIWESCIQGGLVPSNRYYGALFSASSIAAQIVDDRQSIRYSSQNPVEQKENLRLQSLPIRGGHMQWAEDVSAVQRLIFELGEIQELLSQDNSLLTNELGLKKREAQISEQNRLYDRLSAEIERQIALLTELLNAETTGDQSSNQRLSRICVISAYIKRRCNLVLLGEHNATLELTELASSIRESVEYLSVYGINCSFERRVSGTLSFEKTILLYDLFESLVETALPELNSLLINLTVKEGVGTLKLVFDSRSALANLDLHKEQLLAQGVSIETTESEGEWFVTIGIAEGGDGE